VRRGRVLLLSRVDSISGEACPLQATVDIQVEPPLPEPVLIARLTEALEAAIGLGQSRYHLYRDEMPSRRAAVEEAARAALATTLEREGHPLRAFVLVALEAEAG
jgi:hypothetical protein